jgi:transcriptional regulator with XRE-family HTH domain
MKSSENITITNQEIAGRVREALAAKRMSRQELADRARISLSTLEKALAGSRSFTLPTLVRLEQVLDVALRPKGIHQQPATAHIDLGDYTRSTAEWLAGSYLTIRASFEKPDALYAYMTTIRWDEALGCLVFLESARLDAQFTQEGLVSLPHQSGHIYLMTNDHGQFRLVVLSRPSRLGEMHGLLTTLQSGRGGHLTPLATPIVLIRATDAVELGQIDATSDQYEDYRRRLTRSLDEEFCRIVVP